MVVTDLQNRPPIVEEVIVEKYRPENIVHRRVDPVPAAVGHPAEYLPRSLPP